MSISAVSTAKDCSVGQVIMTSIRPIRACSRRYIPRLLKVFMNHTTIPFHLFGTFLLNEILLEWVTFMHRTLFARDYVLAKTRERLVSLTSKETKTVEHLNVRTLQNTIDSSRHRQRWFHLHMTFSCSEHHNHLKVCGF